MAIITKASYYSPRSKTDRLYFDIRNNFDRHPDLRDVDGVGNEDAVSQSIKNLLFTNPGERLFQPDLGSDINRTLFENISAETESLIRTYVETTIKNYEPRADLIEVLVTAIPEMNTYSVTIVFGVVNRTEPVVLELLLSRVR